MINGIVADSITMDPLPYITIRVKHTVRGTTSDSQGAFKLLVSSRDTIQFTAVGYKTLEMAVWHWEPSVILMAEDVLVLSTVTVEDASIDHVYDHMFDDQNKRLAKANKKIPFYKTKEKKEKIRLGRLENELDRVNTYVELVINNPQTRENLMAKYKLSEDEYYKILTRFNEENFEVMYYLTESELLSMLNRFFQRYANKKE